MKKSNGWKVEKIAVEKLRAEDWNRPLETPGAELEVLTASMKALGQLDPIVVRPLEGGEYEVISGNRRLAAAKRLGWGELEARVVEMDEGAAKGWAFATNHARKPIGIFWEAVEVRRLREEGKTVGEIGEALGHSQGWVERRLALDLELCKRFAAEVLTPAGIPIEKVHASNLEILGEAPQGVWDWLRVMVLGTMKERYVRHLGQPQWLSGELLKDFKKVEGMPWSGAYKKGKRSEPACEECPHFGGKLAVLFPELEAVQSSKGCCTQRECIEWKQACARAAAKKALLPEWVGNIAEEGKLPGGEGEWTKCKEARAELAVLRTGENSGKVEYFKRKAAKEGEEDKRGQMDGGMWCWTNEQREELQRRYDEVTAEVFDAPVPTTLEGVELPGAWVQLLERVHDALVHKLHKWWYGFFNGTPGTRLEFLLVSEVFLGTERAAEIWNRCAKCGRLLPILTSGFRATVKDPGAWTFEPKMPNPNESLNIQFGVEPCDHCDGRIRGLYARLRHALDSVGIEETEGTGAAGGAE